MNILKTRLCDTIATYTLTMQYPIKGIVTIIVARENPEFSVGRIITDNDYKIISTNSAFFTTEYEALACAHEYVCNFTGEVLFFDVG